MNCFLKEESETIGRQGAIEIGKYGAKSRSSECISSLLH